MKTRTSAYLLSIALLAAAGFAHGQDGAPPAAGSIRLYVLDSGVLQSDPTRYHLTESDVGTTALSVAAYLIVHPKGVLLWDTGDVPDAERVSSESGVEQHLVLADGADRYVTLGPPLLGQLAAIGYSPADITHLALSHYHWDHSANANSFAAATWLVRPAEWQAMFAAKPEGSVRPATYAALARSPTIFVTSDDYDVFGDGTVILKSAPGHTPGHQLLYVKLARTGGVVLSGDLYHYPAERALGRLPTFEFDAAATAASRQTLEKFLARTGATLWIGHDLVAHRKLMKAPQYYD